MKKKTPEEIQAMEAEVNEYRAQEARERAIAQREAAKPVIDMVGTDTFKGMESAVPDLETMSTTIPEIRVHVDALRHGLFGLRQFVDLLPAEDAPAAQADATQADA